MQTLILFIERTFSEPDMKGTGAALRAWIERKQKLVRCPFASLATVRCVFHHLTVCVYVRVFFRFVCLRVGT